MLFISVICKRRKTIRYAYHLQCDFPSVRNSVQCSISLCGVDAMPYRQTADTTLISQKHHFDKRCPCKSDRKSLSCLALALPSHRQIAFQIDQRCIVLSHSREGDFAACGTHFSIALLLNGGHQHIANE